MSGHKRQSNVCDYFSYDSTRHRSICVCQLIVHSVHYRSQVYHKVKPGTGQTWDGKGRGTTVRVRVSRVVNFNHILQAGCLMDPNIASCFLALEMSAFLHSAMLYVI